MVSSSSGSDGTPEPVGVTRYVDINEHGDTILVVGDEVYKKELLVSASMLGSASAVFYHMLVNPHWNSAPTENAGTRRVDLKDDEPESMELLCKVLHHQIRTKHEISNIPARLMRYLVITADKYACLDAVTLIGTLWLEVFSPAGMPTTACNQLIADAAVIATSLKDETGNLLNTVARLAVEFSTTSFANHEEVAQIESIVPLRFWLAVENQRMQAIAEALDPLDVFVMNVEDIKKTYEGHSSLPSGSSFKEVDLCGNTYSIIGIRVGKMKTAVRELRIAKKSLELAFQSRKAYSLHSYFHALKTLKDDCVDGIMVTPKSGVQVSSDFVASKSTCLMEDLSAHLHSFTICALCIHHKAHADFRCDNRTGLCPDCVDKVQHKKDQCQLQKGHCTLCDDKNPHKKADCPLDVGLCDLCRTCKKHGKKECPLGAGWPLVPRKRTASDAV